MPEGRSEVTLSSGTGNVGHERGGVFDSFRSNATFAAALGVFGVFVAIGTGMGMLLGPPSARPLFGTLGLLGASLLVFLWFRGEDLLRAYRRSKAIGAAPALVSYAVLSLRLRPTMEAAADLAGDAVGGRLGTSLARHRRASPTGREAFESFADDWADLDPSLPRAVSLMGVAIDTPSDDRPAVLERALNTVLDGARERVAAFASDIRGPVMGIYAFGVMLPLALVGMLPVVSTTGGGVPLVLLAVGYDFVIPVGLLVAGGWLAAKRPAVAAPSGRPPIFGGSMPSKPIAAGAVACLLGLVSTPLFFPDWSRWLIAIGSGIGTFLVVLLSALREKQEAMAEIEAGLPDAITVVGQSLAEGTPIEGAVATVGDRASGEVGALFERADERRRRLGVSVEEAFHGDVGVLQSVPSNRIATAVSLVVAAAEHGPSGGRTLQSVAEYLESLRRVEREGRRELAQTTSTLRQTAIVFAPAIAGVTVALATGMDGVAEAGKPVEVAMLGRIIGWYVVLLAVVLPSLSVVLERGFEPIRMGYRSGIALVTGVLVYPLTFLAARSLVYA